MSRWDDQFETHGVFSTLATVRERLDKIGEDVSVAEETESHARLTRVVDYVERSLKDADPELVGAGLLDQISGQLDAMANALQQYEATPQQAYLDQANSYADALLGPAQQLSPRASSVGTHDLQSAVSTFRRSAGQHLRHIEQEVSELQAKADEAKQCEEVSTKAGPFQRREGSEPCCTDQAGGAAHSSLKETAWRCWTRKAVSFALQATERPRMSTCRR